VQEEEVEIGKPEIKYRLFEGKLLRSYGHLLQLFNYEVSSKIKDKKNYD